MSVRVRFAPSPTGPLHIGGVRTALYNVLLAQKTGGTFILRIEDTDQKRYVQGAEDYIKDSLSWLGLIPDEGPDQGGDYGPYRQSARSDLYKKWTQYLVDQGKAYYAFDTPEELDAMRARLTAVGIHSPKYDASTRMDMRNSLSLSDAETAALLAEDTPHVVRLLVEPGQTISFEDVVRGVVSFDSAELDDKVLMKNDGLPTYHLANVVDDYHMKITHVIRGEEWLSSTAHHVLLYRAFGWEQDMPIMSHLPLILKPTGKGKLSKRDGQKLGIPVFPKNWTAENPEDSFYGFDHYGFLPDAIINFLAFLGWNPGTEQEIFSRKELADAFSLEQIGKSGARFDYDKARWFNQQYIQEMPAELLSQHILPLVDERLKDRIEDITPLIRPRLTTLEDIAEQLVPFNTAPLEYDQKQLKKRGSEEGFQAIEHIGSIISTYEGSDLQSVVKAWITDAGLGFGKVLPLLRMALCGGMSGPDLFQLFAVIGREEAAARISTALAAWR